MSEQHNLERILSKLSRIEDEYRNYFPDPAPLNRNQAYIWYQMVTLRGVITGFTSICIDSKCTRKALSLLLQEYKYHCENLKEEFMSRQPRFRAGYSYGVSPINTATVKPLDIGESK